MVLERVSQELGAIGRGAEAVVRLVWRLNGLLGPLMVLASFGLSALVGFISKSPAWGVVTLLALLVLLTFAEVVRRERHPGATPKGETQTVNVTYYGGEHYHYGAGGAPGLTTIKTEGADAAHAAESETVEATISTPMAPSADADKDGGDAG
ncbi:MAG TPA: hypothetical protein VND62_12020 [Acidimicrobiales bacterium]|nr:hypothetical protein [Acidimicrobiales bacterium]